MGGAFVPSKIGANEVSRGPPDQRVKRNEIRGQQGVGGEPPQKSPDVHHLSSRDSVGNYEAENDDAKRREPDARGTRQKWKQDNARHGQQNENAAANKHELQLDFLRARRS